MDSYGLYPNQSLPAIDMLREMMKRRQSRPENARTDAYWRHSARPLISLVFVAPILLLYESGILWLGPEAMRNGADVWLREFLNFLGFGQYFLLPVMVCAILLAWHHLTRQRWRFSATAMGGMWVESTCLGMLLLGVAQLQSWLFMAATEHWDAAAGISLAQSGAGAHLVGYFGAGVYEELLFRLVLLPLIAGLMQWAGQPRQSSLVIAILISSLLFSAAHFQWFTPGGDLFGWFSFLFRFIAGIFFSVLFLLRGFGITVGTHTLYDVMIGVLFGLQQAE